MNKPKVGDKLYLVNEGINVGRSSQDAVPPEYVTVTKVGRKYMEAGGHVFVIDPMGIAKDHYLERIEYGSSRWSLYPSKEVYDDKVEKGRLVANIKAMFNHYGPSPFKLEQLRAVAEILNDGSVR